MSSSLNKPDVDDDFEIDDDDSLDTTEDILDVKTNDHDKSVRHRLDDILERRRLKALLDDVEDWEL